MKLIFAKPVGKSKTILKLQILFQSLKSEIQRRIEKYGPFMIFFCLKKLLSVEQLFYSTSVIAKFKLIRMHYVRASIRHWRPFDYSIIHL
jgi:hypothetical protein